MVEDKDLPSFLVVLFRNIIETTRVLVRLVSSKFLIWRERRWSGEGGGGEKKKKKKRTKELGGEGRGGEFSRPIAAKVAFGLISMKNIYIHSAIEKN